MTRNEAAERLHHLVVTEAGSLRSPAIARVIREALATERRLTVERVGLRAADIEGISPEAFVELTLFLDDLAAAAVDEEEPQP